MGFWDQFGRALEQSTTVLREASQVLHVARETMEALRPTVSDLPTLVREAAALTAIARRTAEEIAPLLIEGARRTVEVLGAQRELLKSQLSREKSPPGPG